MQLISPDEVIAFHDRCNANAGWTGKPAALEDQGLWRHVEANHRYNSQLWAEEDLARRKDVPDAAIAANKRAIDGFNQKRNDAIERMDEFILGSLADVKPGANARLNSETAGSMIDRLSILSLKIKAMGEQVARTDAGAEHIALCGEKLARLIEQRKDLAGCLDALLAGCRDGSAYYKIYRQFKMYNDPTLNPYLYGGTKVK